MMLSSSIDTKESIYIIVTDIPGAFLHAYMEDTVHMILEGEIAELIVKLEPKHTTNKYGTIIKEWQ